MSIKDKIALLSDKLQKAIVDRGSIIEAIRLKGVPIPEDTLLEDIPQYIMRISGSGQNVDYVLDGILYILSGAAVQGDTMQMSKGEYKDNVLIM